MELVFILIICLCIFAGSSVEKGVADSHELHPSDNLAFQTIYIRTPINKGGKNDNGPTVMFVIGNSDHTVLQGIRVTLIKKGLRYSGKTNYFGVAVFQLPAYGEWRLFVTHSKYRHLASVVTLNVYNSVRLITI